MKQLEQAKLEVIEYANRMLTEGLVKGTSGNVSVRVGDQVAITPGSVPYPEITPDLVAIVDLDGNHVGGGRPSSETPLHTLVYRETDAEAVVHTHSIYATTLACTVDELPAVEAFRPELVIVSAGFDAHHRDPLAEINLTEDDFDWATGKLLEQAGRSASNRLVSLLEGGYDLQGLAFSTAAHVKRLMEG